MPMLRGTAAVMAIGLAGLSLATTARADDARTARLRVLCAQISGGDFAESGKDGCELSRRDDVGCREDPRA